MKHPIFSSPLFSSSAIDQLILTGLPKGNHYCARDYGSSASNANSYHYSNS